MRPSLSCSYSAREEESKKEKTKRLSNVYERNFNRNKNYKMEHTKNDNLSCGAPKFEQNG